MERVIRMFYRVNVCEKKKKNKQLQNKRKPDKPEERQIYFLKFFFCFKCRFNISKTKERGEHYNKEIAQSK